MTARRALPALLAVGLGLAGCSGGDGGSSGSASGTSSASSAAASGGSESAVCESADAVRTSVEGLKSVDLAGGVEGLQDAFATVQSDVKQLADAARDQHADRVDPVEADLKDVQTALDDALADPAGRSPGAVTEAVTTLVDDVDALLEEVGQEC